MCLSSVGNACLTSLFKWVSFKWSYCCKLCLQDWIYPLVTPECSGHGPQDWLVFVTMTTAVLTNRPLFWADRRLARTASSPVSAEMNWWRSVNWGARFSGALFIPCIWALRASDPGFSLVWNTSAGMDGTKAMGAFQRDGNNAWDKNHHRPARQRALNYEAMWLQVKAASMLQRSRSRSQLPTGSSCSFSQTLIWFVI